jgi:hypothetical protein
MSLRAAIFIGGMWSPSFATWERQWNPFSGVRLRVRLNGVEGVLHRPHHSNALDRQGIRYIREYLAHARMTPTQYEESAHRRTRR